MSTSGHARLRQCEGFQYASKKCSLTLPCQRKLLSVYERRRARRTKNGCNFYTVAAVTRKPSDLETSGGHSQPLPQRQACATCARVARRASKCREGKVGTEASLRCALLAPSRPAWRARARAPCSGAVDAGGSGLARRQHEDHVEADVRWLLHHPQHLRRQQGDGKRKANRGKSAPTEGMKRRGTHATVAAYTDGAKACARLGVEPVEMVFNRLLRLSGGAACADAPARRRRLP
eukprot:4753414-Pleurochrysis_carterae.AAC.1